eukprot:3414300-Prymnesium_polylepis.1
MREEHRERDVYTTEAKGRWTRLAIGIARQIVGGPLLDLDALPVVEDAQLAGPFGVGRDELAHALLLDERRDRHRARHGWREAEAALSQIEKAEEAAIDRERGAQPIVSLDSSEGGEATRDVHTISSEAKLALVAID